MKQYWIYKIVNIIDNKVYIGSSLNIKNRKSRHFVDLRKNIHGCQHLQRAYNKHGRGNFLFDIIEVGEYNFSYSDLLLIEDKWVLYYDSLNPLKGYNKMLPSSQKHLEHSFDKSKIGYENYLLINAPHGLTRISKEKWIENRKANPNYKFIKAPKENPIEQKKKVYAIDIISNKIVNTFESQSECQNTLHISDSSLRDALLHNVKNCKYYKLRKSLLLVRESDYFEELVYKSYKGSNIKEIPIKAPIILPIIKIQNLDTLEIKEFNYSTEIASFLNTKPCRIMELKKGFKNKGNGVIQKVTHCKRWKFF